MSNARNLANLGQYAVPTDTTKTYTLTPGTGFVPAASGGGSVSYMHVTEERASGVGGASITAAAGYVTRVLNTTRANTIAGASLSANVVSLPPGTYLLRGKGTITDAAAANHKIRLYNVTASSVIGLGSSEIQTNYPTSSWVFAAVVLSVTTSIRLEHRVSANASQGAPTSLGDNEVYTELTIEKIA
jgi:hypothetical protein